MELDASAEVHTSQSSLEKTVFDLSLQIKRLLQPVSHIPETESSTKVAESNGVKLPKLEVPKFDGHILNWQSFWEQFCVSVHDRSAISDTEKLVYLQQSLKDGAAKGAIEGLSRSGDQYVEAVECLKNHYNRPRLIHQTHVKIILEAPSVKEGNGRELRKLHGSTCVPSRIWSISHLGHLLPQHWN